jgi:hypothetical protein
MLKFPNQTMVEKELVAQPSSYEDLSQRKQERAERLRNRIEELNRRLAVLNSARGIE